MDSCFYLSLQLLVWCGCVCFLFSILLFLFIISSVFSLQMKLVFNASVEYSVLFVFGKWLLVLRIFFYICFYIFVIWWFESYFSFCFFFSILFLFWTVCVECLLLCWMSLLLCWMSLLLCWMSLLMSLFVLNESFIVLNESFIVFILNESFIILNESFIILNIASSEELSVSLLLFILGICLLQMKRG